MPHPALPPDDHTMSHTPTHSSSKHARMCRTILRANDCELAYTQHTLDADMRHPSHPSGANVLAVAADG